MPETPPPLPSGLTRGMPLAQLLSQQKFCRVLTGLLALGLAWVAMGHRLWPCWIFEVTHRPCFTCGMTRGVRRCVTGEWSRVWQAHAFAPLILLLFGAIVLFAILPRAWHAKAVRKLAFWEGKTRFSWLLLGAFAIYGVLRGAGWIAFQP